jgi:hypothetical protein
MASFLELCQAVALEAGISGDIVATSGQLGEAQRVVRWVARAYKYVQNLHQDWKFLRRDVEFSASVGQIKYTPDAAGIPLAEFGRWCFLDEWRSYRTDVGYSDEMPVEYVDYDTYRRRYAYGNTRLQTGRPQVVTVAPDQSLMFWPQPDDHYTIVGEQYRAPHILASDNDVPIFAAQYHDAIMWRAMMFYGEFEGDGTVMATAQSEAEREVAAMESAYLPGMTMRNSRPLA